MASKLYPTLSPFYKAGNVGFGSEHDAMLCGVPDEKLYRKPSRQRGKLSSQNASAHRQLEPSEQQYDEGTESCDAARKKQIPSPSQVSPPEEEDSITPPLSPSAPPLLEMLDLRLQQYLSMLLASSGSSAPLNTALSSEDNQAVASGLPSTSHLDAGSHHTTVTLPLPPNVVVEDSWLDEIQPDYDDLTPEEMADEILNNLNVAREDDTKDHEKQKSLSLLRMPKETPQGETFRGEEERQSQLLQPHHQYQREDHRHRHSYQQQSSQGSRDDNVDTDYNYDYHQQHHDHRHQNQSSNRHKKHGVSRRLQEQESQSRDDLRLAGRTKQQESEERPPRATHNEAAGKDRRRDTAYHHRRSHHNASRSRHENGQSTSDPVEGQREIVKPTSRRKSSAAEKENQHGSPGRTEVHGENSDYNAWMTWRKQVNRQLATIILLKQQGKKVSVQTTDMRRKPLRQSSIDFVSQIATQSGSTTSLGGKPYVMYGIPRASLLPKNETPESKKDS